MTRRAPVQHRYLRPVALHAGTDAAALMAAGLGRAILGGRLATSLVEIIERRGPELGRRLVAGQELSTLDLRTFEAVRPPPFDGPRLMGILNVTPDSFSDGGLHLCHDAAVRQGLAMLEAGADIIDVGGESTRPGAAPVPLEEELRRVVPVVRALADLGARISIDTRKAAVMEVALAAGATIINDVSGLTYDPAALATAAATDAQVVLLHMQGEPGSMNLAPTYEHPALDIHDWLAARVTACEAAGIARSRLIVDPGLCFGKHEPHNLDLLRHLAMFHGLGCPILLGASRKGWTAAIEGVRPPVRRLPASIAAVLWGLEQGVQLFRVHDLAETRLAAEAFAAIGDAT